MLRIGYHLTMGLMLGAAMVFSAFENWAAVFAASSAFMAWTHAYNLRYPATANEAAHRLIELGDQFNADVVATKRVPKKET